MTTGTITLYIATSVDGFVATEDGGVEWLEAFQSTGESDGGYDAFFADIDALVMGSNTYEQVRSFGAWPYEDRPTYVLTHDDSVPVVDTVEFVDEPVADLAPRLREQYGRIWLVGGAQVAREFLEARQVDQLRLTIAPILLGGGICLFGTKGLRNRLKLEETTALESGLVDLRYGIQE
ncbi:dihydrofolate reductase family protein [Natronosalvus halobius]|uniref:dihydrofolate reductase family protein n=1 Tax=Natronosalvus halobius TaxID=2953746 RepID=UPI0020A2154A|nr:dihydrofolate reductase family protein [Natronosalvus halobius]USZ72224.1 dihydrofolate reductase family protein [Natronosalvus halobius]